ncbi:putative uncharacterized protein encoded by LINC01465, partial [Lemur catta]|uniref:putative uncharacterized protein encoded by LINC01465 n=1 Tax=Lemur catta TaxID=9447 RepID=UPI001E267731
PEGARPLGRLKAARGGKSAMRRHRKLDGPREAASSAPALRPPGAPDSPRGCAARAPPRPQPEAGAGRRPGQAPAPRPHPPPSPLSARANAGVHSARAATGAGTARKKPRQSRAVPRPPIPQHPSGESRTALQEANRVNKNPGKLKPAGRQAGWRRRRLGARGHTTRLALRCSSASGRTIEIT